MAYTTTVVALSNRWLDNLRIRHKCLILKYAPVKYPLWGYLTLAFDGRALATQ